MPTGAILGFLGDLLTFAGGGILATDAILREREFQKKRDLINTVQELKKVRLERKGVVLLDEKDVELSFIRQSVWLAKWGVVVLTLGFLPLLSSRTADLLSVSAISSH